MKPPFNHEVVIRKGFAAYGLALIWLVFSLWVIIQILMALLDFGTGKWQPSVYQFVGAVGFVAVSGTGFLWLSLSMIRQKYTVSLEGIEVTRLRDSSFVPWREVEVLNVIPTFAGANNIKIFLHNGKSATLFTAFLAHYEHSAKAIIEAAYLANPNIKMNFVLGNDYGPPPYGIFTVQEAGA